MGLENTIRLYPNAIKILLKFWVILLHVIVELQHFKKKSTIYSSTIKIEKKRKKKRRDKKKEKEIRNRLIKQSESVANLQTIACKSEPGEKQGNVIEPVDGKFQRSILNTSGNVDTELKSIGPFMRSGGRTFADWNVETSPFLTHPFQTQQSLVTLSLYINTRHYFRRWTYRNLSNMIDFKIAFDWLQPWECLKDSQSLLSCRGRIGKSRKTIGSSLIESSSNDH